MDTGVLEHPITTTAPRSQETPPVSPKSRSGGIVMLLLACAVFTAVCAFAISREADTGAVRSQESGVPAENERDIQEKHWNTMRPKPPAPKGFHEFHLGMTRKEVYTMVEPWGLYRHWANGSMLWNSTYCGKAIPPKYADVEETDILFDDSGGLLPDGWNYRRSADLSPDQAKARLKYIAVGFKRVKESSSREVLRPLRERFGPPDSEGRPPPEWSKIDLLARVHVIQGRPLVWTWKEIDRTVIAGVIDDSKLQLAFADGLLARVEERRKREQERTTGVADTIRKGIK